MKLLDRWRAWRNRPRVVTGPGGKAVYLGDRTPQTRWEIPERGTFVVSTAMDPDFDPPSAGLRP